MPTGKVFFFEREKMFENFQRIIQDDPPMGKLTAFYDFLTRFAGKATYPEHACLILAMATRLAGGHPVHLGKHLEAMIDDAETLKEAQQMLDNSIIIARAKHGL